MINLYVLINGFVSGSLWCSGLYDRKDIRNDKSELRYLGTEIIPVKSMEKGPRESELVPKHLSKTHRVIYNYECRLRDVSARVGAQI